MKNYKLKYTFSIRLILLIIIIAFMIYAIPTILTKNIINDETGVTMTFSDKAVFCILSTIVVLTWIFSLIVMLRQKFIIKKAYALSKEGIENILVGGFFMAFIFILPIKLIPWNCIKIDKGNTLNIIFDVKKIPNASFLVKIILKIKGFKLYAIDDDFNFFYDKYANKNE